MHEETKRGMAAIEEQIRIGGPQTIAEIAAALKMTTTVCRARADYMMRDSIIERQAEPGPLTGKPSYVYRLCARPDE